MKSQEKNEVINNKVKIFDKVKKIWMVIKKKLEEKNKIYNKVELWKCIFWRNVIEL